MKKRKATPPQASPWEKLTDEEKTVALAAVARRRKRMRPPGPPGAPLRYKDVATAIEAIAGKHGGVSASDWKHWSQGDWVSEIQGLLRETMFEKKIPEKETIKTHFKTYIARPYPDLPLPLHLLPASLERKKPLTDQFDRWFMEALGAAVIRGSRPKSKRVTARFSVVDEVHRDLCAKHIWRSSLKKPYTEAERLVWLIHKWIRTYSANGKPVLLTSR